MGDELEAIGASYMAQDLLVAAQQSSAPTTPPVPAANVWISGDGSTWRLLPEDPSLIVGSALNTHVASLGTRVVVATYGEVYLGDLTP